MAFLGENIKHLRKLKGITQAQLAQKLGINRSVVGAYEEGRAEPRLQTIINLSHYFEVNIDDLLRKELSTVDNKSKHKFYKGDQLRVLSILVDNNENDELISVVPIKASAGYLNGYGDVDFIEKLDKFKLPIPEISRHSTYRVFQISGDSMLPVKPGSYIICEYVHDWFDVKNDQCYILITLDEGIVYKRIVNNLRDGHFLLKSDNFEYQPYKLPSSQLVEVWKAIGIISFEIPDIGETKSYFDSLGNAVTTIQSDIKDIKQHLQNGH